MDDDARARAGAPAAAPGGAMYGLGSVGAAVYYIGRADGFWPIAGAFLKALAWPAFVVHDLLRHAGA